MTSYELTLEAMFANFERKRARNFCFFFNGHPCLDAMRCIDLLTVSLLFNQRGKGNNDEILFP